MLSVEVINVGNEDIDFPVLLKVGETRSLGLGELEHILRSPKVRDGVWEIEVGTEVLIHNATKMWHVGLGYLIDYRLGEDEWSRANSGNEFPWGLLLEDRLYKFLDTLGNPLLKLITICSQIEIETNKSRLSESPAA